MAKVLLVTNNFPPVRGGSASVYANLARCAEGQVIVLAARNDYSDGLPLIGWREHDRHAGYQVRRLPLLRTVLGRANESRWANTARRLRDIVIRVRLAATLLGTILFQGVRVVCVGELLTGSWIVDFVRILPGVRTVAYVHGEEITTSDSYDTTHSRARHALGASDHIITVSRFTYDAVAALIGPESAGNRIHLIHNGVDTAHFHPRSRPIDLTHLYGLGGCFVFVSVSRLVEKKGTDNTIRAFARMAPDFPDCRLLIVGAGPYRPRLEEIRAEMGVADKVVFTGAVAETELADHYQLGDVHHAEPQAGERRHGRLRRRVPRSQQLRPAGDRGPRRRQHRSGAGRHQRPGGGRQRQTREGKPLYRRADVAHPRSQQAHRSSQVSTAILPMRRIAGRPVTDRAHNVGTAIRACQQCQIGSSRSTRISCSLPRPTPTRPERCQAVLQAQG